MKKTLLFFLLFFSLNFYSQNIKVIEYSYEDYNNVVCSSTLFINNKETIFRVNDERKSGIDMAISNEENYIIVDNDNISTVIYSNDSLSIVRIPLYKDEIIYSDSIDKINYSLTGKTKDINGFSCQEAITKFNGRTYFIWFTPEIAVNYGPLKLNGLPGLIIEVVEVTKNIKIKFKSINEIKEIKTFEYYKKYITEKKSMNYSTYENKIIDIMKTNKAKKLATLAELNATIEFDKNHKSFTNLLIDVPKDLVSELLKIQ